MPKSIFTLCIVHDNQRILLGFKKRGFGEVRWNGFGGKVEKGEDIESAAKREMEEECSLTPVQMEKCGILEFTAQGESRILEIHVFRVSRFAGEPRESSEMKPQWFQISCLPFEKMWPADHHWFSLLLDNKKFRGSFIFDSFVKPSTVEKKSLYEVNSFN